MDQDIFKIQEIVKRGIESLTPHYKSWIERRLIEPEKVAIYTDLDCTTKEKYWLLTEDPRLDDTNHRLLYFSEMDMFGLAVKLEDGRTCCLGLYDSFAEAVKSM
jgi:hypothetical protein